MTIQVPAIATAQQWFELVQIHNRLMQTPGEVVLDASATTRVGPLGATVLAVAIARREHAGLPRVAWVSPSNDDCAAFLTEIGFSLYVTGTAEERASASRGGTLEIRQIRGLDPTYHKGVADLLADRVPGTTEDVSHLVQLCLNELMGNVVDHSRSPIGCFIHTRWYAKEGNVRIAIVDAGAGIPGALRSVPRYAGYSDKTLLYEAIVTEGVTSRPPPRTGGYGLKTIRTIVTQRDGGLIVVSGGAKFEVRGHRRPSTREISPTQFVGTAIELDFRPLPEAQSGGEEVF